MLAFGRSPFRCRRCERRFYESTGSDRQHAEEAPADSER